MNKYFTVFLMFALAAAPAFAVSTCETRVDSHQDATTQQRVAYCLTPEAMEPAAPGPQVIYYGVSGNQPDKKKKQEQEEREPVYFDKNGVYVEQSFVDSKQFPPFENDRLSEQEKSDAVETGRLEAQKATGCCEEKLFAAAEENALLGAESKETAAGLLARQTKPRRFMKEPAYEPENSSADTAQAYSINAYGVGGSADNAGYDDMDALMGTGTPAAGYSNQAQPSAYTVAQPAAGASQPAVPTGTPQNEIQQAYALENNPLSQPSGNAGGAAPNGYLDNNLTTGGQSFGYNSTDPAMQP